MTTTTTCEAEMTDAIADAPEFKESLAEVTARLAELSVLEYERIRVAEAKQLGARVTVLDEEVKQRRKQALRDAAQARAGEGLGLTEPLAPWDETVDGRALLDQIHAILRRFIVAPESALVAVTLWLVFTYLIENKKLMISPRLAITSPEKGVARRVSSISSRHSRLSHSQRQT